MYIDDFIALIQTTNEDEIKRLTRCLLHAITDIFPAPSETGSKMGPPISTKKLIEVGTWETHKEILGWMLDGITRTISLPQPKCDKILLELKAIRHSKCVPFNRLEKLKGKLTFAAITIQVGKPLLGQVDKILAIANKDNFNNITVNTIVKQYCTTWTSLLKLMSSRPTHVRKLTPRTTASYQGLCDASS